ncbi:hypothetical protein [Macrococcus lamae]|uniref:Uncharacterized protein n=1 Tax=Macrococcus lamae TaxID=198484 RepID=A0A4R6BVB3_9STAP|nr:hypothetical protein [Macrococcus lamae]TDM12222.1 hypothetical protein ERX29_03920 [Macrococcus lamae]
MNQKIKTAVNVGAVILVPLIKERHRLKQNHDYIRMRNRTMHTLSTSKDLVVITKDKAVSAGHKVSDKAVNAKDKTVKTASFISQTTHDLQEKKVTFEHEYAEKKKIKHEEKMNQKLAKSIEKRHVEEEKANKQRQKEMVKVMKAAEKREKKMPLGNKQATQFVHQQVVKQQMTDQAFHDVNDYINDRVLSHEYEEERHEPLFDKHRLQMAEQIRRRGKY